MKPAAATRNKLLREPQKRLDGEHFKRKLENNTSTRFRVRRVAGRGIDTAPRLAIRY
jgi:hypothetical protein